MKKTIDIKNIPDLEAAELITINNLQKFDKEEILITLDKFIKTQPEIRLRLALALCALLLEEK